MTYEERTKLEGELMTSGIFLSDFISSSTYDAVVKILHESKQASTNTLLAVSGPLEEEIDLAAMQYATKMSAAPDKETPDWIMTDFKAGIAWLLRYQAACASAEGGQTGE